MTTPGLPGLPPDEELVAGQPVKAAHLRAFKDYVDAVADQALAPSDAVADAAIVRAKVITGVTPSQFGAVGDGVTDDGVALQAFLDFVTANDVKVADWSGAYVSSVPLILGRLAAPKTLRYRGRFFLTMTGTGGVAFTVKDANTAQFDYLEVTGPGSTSYASRTWQVAILLDNSSRCAFGVLRGRQVSYAGVLSINNAVGNSSLTGLGLVRVSDCGSGVRSGSLSLTTTFSNPVRAGSSGSTAQTTVINVATLPPTFITDGTYGPVNSTPYLLRVTETGGATQLHYITAVDRAAGTLTVFPWVSDTADVAVAAEYVWGGGVHIAGANANLFSFDGVDAVRCGIGLVVAGLYGPTGQRVTAQACGAGIMLGGRPAGSVVGSRIDGLYVEDNTEDIAVVGRPGVGQTLDAFYNIIGSEHALNLNKVYAIGARLSTNVLTPSGRSLGSTRLAYRGRLHSTEKVGLGADGTTPSPEIVRPDQSLRLSGNNFTITPVLDANLNRLFGYDSLMVTITGSGAAGQPTGTITFPVPAGYTLAATGTGLGARADNTVSALFTGATGPAQFLYKFRVDTLVATVTKLAG